MILHLVSDRRRLAPSASDADAQQCLLAQVRHAVDAGLEVVHLRERDLEAGALVRLVRACVTITRGTGTRLVVNDRLDVAIAGGADGVHLRGDSLDAHAVRRLTPPGFIVGRSVHATGDVGLAGPVDYLLAGTVWPTASKPVEHRLLGLDGLAAICALATVPVLAIGGIDAGRSGDVARAGAAGAAAIGAFITGRDPHCRAAGLSEAARHLRDGFDTVMARS